MDHLQVIKDYRQPLPVVNQIEMYPLLYKEQLTLIWWYEDHNIRRQAYVSILHKYNNWFSLDIITSMSKTKNKTIAQLLLRPAIKQDFLIIPKSIHKEHIKENANLYNFALSYKEITSSDDWGDWIRDKQKKHHFIYKKGWN